MDQRSSFTSSDMDRIREHFISPDSNIIIELKKLIYGNTYHITGKIETYFKKVYFKIFKFNDEYYTAYCEKISDDESVEDLSYVIDGDDGLFQFFKMIDELD
jgi:hypothetical protein